MKIYTKTGDAGQTSLFGGDRVDKDHLRIQAIGSVDELNAVLGVVRAEWSRPGGEANRVDAWEALLERVQNELFALGAELATPEPASKGTELIQMVQIQALEQAIDRWEEGLPPLKNFVLPGGTPAAAQLHVARCVCRRAERTVVPLGRATPLRSEPLIYLNRLSDLLFVLARAANQHEGQPDVVW